jgi:CTP:molybdopterin cytidylyltransferase MocA
MIVGVVLAAGASSRFGSPKPMARTRGGSFLVAAVRALWHACDEVVVVLGAQAAAVQRAAEAEFVALAEAGALAAAVHAPGRKGRRALEVRFVRNPAWKRGMLGSARIGLAEALRPRTRAVMVLPVDHPQVRGTTAAQLAEVMEEALGAFGRPQSARFPYALVPRHRQRRGHPLVLSTALARAVMRDSGAEDLSDAVRRSARLVGYLDVADPGVVRDRDTPRD